MVARLPHRLAQKRPHVWEESRFASIAMALSLLDWLLFAIEISCFRFFFCFLVGASLRSHWASFQQHFWTKQQLIWMVWEQVDLSLVFHGIQHLFSDI